MSEELKPCPFCGGKVDMCKSPTTSGYVYFASCDTDGCFANVAFGIQHSFSEKESIETWNSRA